MIRRYLPLAAVLAAAIAVLATGLHRELSLDGLAARQAALAGLVAAQPLLTGGGYVLLYALVVALSLPGGAVMTLAGGLLFGAWLGSGLAIVAATIGAIGVFLAARSALAAPLARRAGPLLDRIRPGLERDGFWYLMTLRLLPIAPFWLVNLAPALAGMRLAPFALATLIGIIPGTAVFASIGAGIGGVLAAGGRPDLSVVLSPQILLPLLGLAALSLLPVLLRRRAAPHGPKVHQ